MNRVNDEAGKLLNAVYMRLMGTRADEISRLKEARLAKQLREKEEELRKLDARHKAVQSRFERFVRSYMKDSSQQMTKFGLRNVEFRDMEGA